VSDHVRPISGRTQRWILVFLAFVALMAAAAIFLALHGEGEQKAKEAAQGEVVQKDNEIKDLSVQVQEVCAQGGAPAAKLRAEGLCDRTKQIVERGPAGPQGETGAMGPMGPMGPQGPRGFIGPPGNSPACLLTPGRCQGPKGADGKDGVDGSDGADGSDGVDGADGQDGQDGLDGKNGVSIVSATCRDPDGEEGGAGFSWLVKFSDGTSDLNAGLCRGPKGDEGNTGPAIKSWTFTQGGFTYTCTDPDGDLAYTCESTPPQSAIGASR
jgi:hypothetical protein